MFMVVGSCVYAYGMDVGKVRQVRELLVVIDGLERRISEVRMRRWVPVPHIPVSRVATEEEWSVLPESLVEGHERDRFDRTSSANAAWATRRRNEEADPSEFKRLAAGLRIMDLEASGEVFDELGCLHNPW